MSAQHAPQRYGIVAMLLHWSIAACVLITIPFAWTIGQLDAGDVKSIITESHKSLGITIFLLTLARVVWRLTHKAPPLPASVPALQRYAASVTHVLLYVLMLAMPISGYVSVAARGRGTMFLGLVDVPRWVPLDRLLSRSAEAYHAYGQYVLYALLVMHVGAAIYHQFLRQDAVLSRMIPARIK